MVEIPPVDAAVPEPRGGPGRDIRDDLLRTRIAPDLLAALKKIKDEPSPSSDEQRVPVIIELNSGFPGGTEAARTLLIGIFDRAGLIPADGRLSVAPVRLSAKLVQPDSWNPLSSQDGDVIDVWKSLHTDSYVFARLSVGTIEALATLDSKPPSHIHPVYKIWRDHPVDLFVYESARTIKCDAARVAFATAGEGIVWAVADTGIDGGHPHFARHANLELPQGLLHRDFTGTYTDDDDAQARALTDTVGHGTHVAGIIAGETLIAAAAPGQNSAAISKIYVERTVRMGSDATTVEVDDTRTEISGIAPKCKLLSLKVLQTSRSGLASDLLAAIGYIRQINGPRGPIKVHGLNLSLGYPFDAEWFAAGQSPLCLEVDRLVKSGVLVVAAAGNAGYGRVMTQRGTTETAALMCTIADPGNAALAITVGSTHRNMPHVYGVSYFSAKGPTADGRMKPDLVAPGERIVSCAANASEPGTARFREDSGTSMAAPHVSGAIAGFLSVRREFIEYPERVKELFVTTATNLQRRPEFQGAGMVDLMRALQNI